MGRAAELNSGVLPRDGRGSHQPLKLHEGHREEVYLEDTRGGKAVCVTVVPNRVAQAYQLHTHKHSLVENLVPCTTTLVQITHDILYQA